MERDGLRYRAFISYSHADHKFASRLFRQLENYRLPKSATPSEQRRLGRFFMDREALVAAHDLSQEIVTALTRSETLIVICSPAAAASEWVTKEIEAFRKLRPDGQILTAIAAGNPVTRTGNEACFPAILLEGTEPLAADLRKSGDGSKLGFFKLAAALSGAPLEALTRREAARRNRRVMLVTATTSVIALVMSGLAFSAISARKAADERRAEAEDMVDFMLGDLRDRLEPVGRLDVLDGVATKVLDYYDGQDEAALDCDAAGHKARALHLAAELEIESGESESAITLAQAALALTGNPEERCEGDTSAIYDHARSLFWAGHASHKLNDHLNSKAYLTEYLKMSRNLVREHPDNELYRREEIDALSSLGAQRQAAGATQEAVYFLELAEAGYLKLQSGSPQDTSLALELTNIYGWIAAIHLADEQFAPAIENRRNEIAALQTLIDGDSGDVWDLRWRLTNAQTGLGLALVLANDTKLAIAPLEHSLLTLNELTLHDPSNRLWWQTHVSALVILAASNERLGNTQSAVDLRRRAEDLVMIGNEHRGLSPAELYDRTVTHLDLNLTPRGETQILQQD